MTSASSPASLRRAMNWSNARSAGFAGGLRECRPISPIKVCRIRRTTCMHAFIGLPTEERDTSWHFTGPGQRTDEITLQPVYSVNSVMMVRLGVLAGMGIAILPWQMVADDLAAGTLTAHHGGSPGERPRRQVIAHLSEPPVSAGQNAHFRRPCARAFQPAGSLVVTWTTRAHAEPPRQAPPAGGRSDEREPAACMRHGTLKLSAYRPWSTSCA